MFKYQIAPSVCNRDAQISRLYTHTSVITCSDPAQKKQKGCFSIEMLCVFTRDEQQLYFHNYYFPTRRQDGSRFNVDYCSVIFNTSKGHTHSSDSQRNIVWSKAALLINPELHQNCLKDIYLKSSNFNSISSGEFSIIVLLPKCATIFAGFKDSDSEQQFMTKQYVKSIHNKPFQCALDAVQIICCFYVFLSGGR